MGATAKFTSHVTTQGSKLVAVAAKARKKPKPKPKPPKRVTKVETIASGSYSIPTGKSSTVTLSLNSTGKKLLTARYTVSPRSPSPAPRRRRRRPPSSKLALASALKKRHLSPHSSVTIQITAPNVVGDVVIFTIVSGKSPTETFRRLPPGARAPSACVR